MVTKIKTVYSLQIVNDAIFLCNNQHGYKFQLSRDMGKAKEYVENLNECVRKYNESLK